MLSVKLSITPSGISPFQESVPVTIHAIILAIPLVSILVFNLSTIQK